MKKNTEEGFVGIVILVIVALILLKYFVDFDVFAAAQTQQGHATIGYAQDIFRTIWSYISTPVMFAWNRIVWPLLMLFWQTFEHFLSSSSQNLQSGGSTDIFH